MSGNVPEKPVRLNLGSGADYREGFINIDGIPELPRVDKIIDLSRDSLISHFAPGSVDYLLMNDFLEHHFHWEAMRILKDCFTLLRPRGGIEIRVPDFGFIVRTFRYRPEIKIIMLFGGQDTPQSKEGDAHRCAFPEFYCHKYAYTQLSLRLELQSLGFVQIRTRRSKSNFVATASKPEI